MNSFLLLWLCQTISQVGSQLTGFALCVDVYQRTNSITVYGLVASAMVVPKLLTTPFAGVLVDHGDRRRILISAHAGAGLCSLAMAILAMCGALQLWSILLGVSVIACFNSLQSPAFLAVTSSLVPSAQLGRANGLIQLSFAISQILAPVAAAAILPTMGLAWILVIDVISFAFAVGVLALLRRRLTLGATRSVLNRPGVMAELPYGWRFIRTSPGLTELLVLVAAVSFNMGMVQALFIPFLLAVADTHVLGVLTSVAGLGGLCGGVLMAMWGGPKRQIHGVLGFALVQSLFLLLGVGRVSVPLVGLGAFGVAFTFPLISGCNQTIWQRKIPPEAQGRVFAFQGMATGASIAVAFVVAGPLTEGVFNPLVTEGGVLWSVVGGLLGRGPGRGIALEFIMLGVLLLAGVIAACASQRVRLLGGNEAEVDASWPQRSPHRIATSDMSRGTVSDE